MPDIVGKTWFNRAYIGRESSPQLQSTARDIAKGALSREYLLEHPGAQFTIEEDVRKCERPGCLEYYFTLTPHENY